jgi:glycosyltransferase involved in cell wall biosynthesis
MPDPHLPDVGVLALVPDRFDVPWMSRHQILSRLARYYPVVWLNPARPWREVVASRGPAAADGAVRIAEPPPGLEVYEPGPGLPMVNRPAWIERWTDTTRLSIARRRLLRRGCRRVLLYIWRPDFASALDRVAHDASLYHVVDEYDFSERDLPVSELESQLLRRVDRVLIHSPGLWDKKGGFNPNSGRLPNGVDFEQVSRTRAEPEDLQGIARPLIGYCGWLKKHLDWTLIGQLARAHPAWSFVFAGGVVPRQGLEGVIEELDRLSNVHFLGSKSSPDLMAYPQHFDVCIMPYRETDYTQHIYPLKLHEYLAGGRPVVGSPIRTLRDFEGTIGLARSPEAWSTAIEAALSPAAQAEEARSARRATARRHDWGAIAHHVAAELATLAGPDVAERFEAIEVPELWRERPGSG